MPFDNWIGGFNLPPFLIAVIIGTILMAVFPQIILILPNLMY